MKGDHPKAQRSSIYFYLPWKAVSYTQQLHLNESNYNYKEGVMVIQRQAFWLLTLIFSNDVNKGWWSRSSPICRRNGAVVGSCRWEATKGYAASYNHSRQGRERARSAGDGVINNDAILEVWLGWLPREWDLSSSNLLCCEAEWWSCWGCTKW